MTAAIIAGLWAEARIVDGEAVTLITENRSERLPMLMDGDRVPENSAAEDPLRYISHFQCPDSWRHLSQKLKRTAWQPSGNFH